MLSATCGVSGENRSPQHRTQHHTAFTLLRDHGCTVPYIYLYWIFKKKECFFSPFVKNKIIQTLGVGILTGNNYTIHTKLTICNESILAEWYWYFCCCFSSSKLIKFSLLIYHFIFTTEFIFQKFLHAMKGIFVRLLTVITKRATMLCM